MIYYDFIPPRNFKFFSDFVWCWMMKGAYLVKKRELAIKTSLFLPSPENILCTLYHTVTTQYPRQLNFNVICPSKLLLALEVIIPKNLKKWPCARRRTQRPDSLDSIWDTLPSREFSFSDWPMYTISLNKNSM